MWFGFRSQNHRAEYSTKQRACMFWCVYFSCERNTFLCVAFLCVLGTGRQREAHRAGAQRMLLQTAFIKANQGHLMPKAAWCPRIPPACTLALLKLICRLRWGRAGRMGILLFLCEEMGLSWRGSAAIEAPFPARMCSECLKQNPRQGSGAVGYSRSHTLRHSTVRIHCNTGLCESCWTKLGSVTTTVFSAAPSP